MGHMPIEAYGKSRERKRFPWAFEEESCRKAGNNYTPFEEQLLASYWALVETEQLTIKHEVALHPEIPIMQWVKSSLKTHRIQHAQESNIIKV